MSSWNETAITADLQATLLQELETGIIGLNATKYLSLAGYVILLYDHILLFGEEKRLIWAAKPNWSRSLFLVNRYAVPFCLAVTMYQLSGITTAGLSTSTGPSCRTWMSVCSFLIVITLAVANVFVVHRIYILWDRNPRILKVLVAAFITVYFAGIVSMGFSIYQMILDVSFSPVVQTCVITRRPRVYAIPLALPIMFDVFLLSLTCWNAFDRPRSMQTIIAKQLQLDGAVYFATLLSLRVFNILIILFAHIAYIQLGVYFMWAMITALINRMLITITSMGENTQTLTKYTTRSESPFEHPFMEMPFELELDVKNYEDEDSSFKGGHSFKGQHSYKGHSFEMYV